MGSDGLCEWPRQHRHQRWTSGPRPEVSAFVSDGVAVVVAVVIEVIVAEEFPIQIRPHLVFTTHTPVAAGHDYFSPDLMERHFGAYVGQLGISMHELFGLGRHNPDDYREYFCMTILAYADV